MKKKRYNSRVKNNTESRIQETRVLLFNLRFTSKIYVDRAKNSQFIITKRLIIIIR